ncbi:MAG: type II toxin-antitoxin system HicB family antitoxin [Deltaproteobacteria bacterium]|nr:type II toxin-antitoxin system HicB family antitoxin [Deltaproteobacteria bacterium]
MKVKIEFIATLPIKIVKKNKCYVASCPILDVFSQGDTEDIARKNLSEALSLFFRSCFERGTLDAVLKQCGFSAVEPGKTEIKTKNSIADRDDYISIPIPFLVSQNSQTECHA